MKIRRFVDKDSRGAMAQARNELGAEAVILSNKRVGDTVELVVAVDLDEVTAAHEAAALSNRNVELAQSARPADLAALSDLQREIGSLRSVIEGKLSDLAWQDVAREPSVKGALRARLAALGLSRGLVNSLSDELAERDDLEAYWESALQALATRIQVMPEDSLVDRKGVVALMGSTGVGKTTTIAKLAARAVMRHGSDQVALITTDCYRIGGQEQLQTFAKYLGVPMAVATDAPGLSRLLAKVADKRLVLIDTAGMSQRDVRLYQQYSTLQAATSNVDAYVVLPATGSRRALTEVVNTFGSQALAGAIVTKVDEAVDLGGVIDVAAQTRLPLAYVSDGQKVPDNLAPARAHSIVAAAVELTAEHPVDAAQAHDRTIFSHSTRVDSVNE